VADGDNGEPLRVTADPEADPLAEAVAEVDAAAEALAEDRAEDRRLLTAHIDGDPEAFGHLVARHQNRLWAVALRTTGNPDDAADALQDAMISAFRAAGSYRGDAAVTTWLHRIVVNASLDRLRRNATRRTVALPEWDDESTADTDALVDPNDALANRELRLEIDRALASIPDDQRAAVVLVDIEGLSVSEAAEALGIPDGTVKSRCSRGRARLAVLLKDVRNPDGDTRVKHNGTPEPTVPAATRSAPPGHHTRPAESPSPALVNPSLTSSPLAQQTEGSREP